MGIPLGGAMQGRPFILWQRGKRVSTSVQKDQAAIQLIALRGKVEKG